jgi:hypothetical protein
MNKNKKIMILQTLKKIVQLREKMTDIEYDLGESYANLEELGYNIDILDMRDCQGLEREDHIKNTIARLEVEINRNLIDRFEKEPLV